jgi:hypothetical protein
MGVLLLAICGMLGCTNQHPDTTKLHQSYYPTFQIWSLLQNLNRNFKEKIKNESSGIQRLVYNADQLHDISKENYNSKIIEVLNRSTEVQGQIDKHITEILKIGQWNAKELMLKNPFEVQEMEEYWLKCPGATECQSEALKNTLRRHSYFITLETRYHEYRDIYNLHLMTRERFDIFTYEPNSDKGLEPLVDSTFRKLSWEEYTFKGSSAILCLVYLETLKAQLLKEELSLLVTIRYSIIRHMNQK